MSSLPTVLIFTYAEYGQATVNLAIAYELALAGVNVHIASFPPLKARVDLVQRLVERHASRFGVNPTGSIIFRECKGPGPHDAVMKRGIKNANFAHSHGVSGALKSYLMLDVVILPWSQGEYIAGIEDCRDILAAIRPDMVLIEHLFNAAQDACKLVDQKFIVISPMSLKVFAMSTQPYLAAFWKYPALSSGFSFPLKLWQIPLNIYLNIRFIRRMKTSSKIKQIRVLRKSIGFETVTSDLGDRLYPGVMNISPALPGIDFPYAIIPGEMHLCGPIIMPFDPLKETNPELWKWLDNGPTVLVNLGTLVVSDGYVVTEMAIAFRTLLNYHDQRGISQIQVLWKARTSGDGQALIHEIMGDEIKDRVVKVLPWLEVEPASILQHPNVVCTVHHGGANSFYEGVWSGTPQVVLPVWYDTYEYASRAEFLKIGIFANKTCAPSVRADEFSKALVRITGNSEEASEFRRSAKFLKGVCRAKGNGRELCASTILKEAGIRK